MSQGQHPRSSAHIPAMPAHVWMCTQTGFSHLAAKCPMPQQEGPSGPQAVLTSLKRVRRKPREASEHHPPRNPTAHQLSCTWGSWSVPRSRRGRELCLPSVRMVKGESPRRLAENCPPSDVIRKHRVKNPMPSTNILQEGKQSCSKV